MSNIVGTTIVSLIGLFLTPLLIHQLGTERFGIWTLILSVVAYVELADFGVGLSVQRYVAQYISQANREKILTMTRQAFTMVAVTLVVLSIPLFLLNQFLPALFCIPSLLVTETQWSMTFLIASMIVMVPLSVLTGVISGSQRYDLLNLNWILFSALRSLTLIGCAFLPSPLVAMGITVLLLSFVRLASLTYMIKHLYPGFRLGFQWPDTPFVSQVATYGGHLFLLSLLGRLTFASAPLIIGLFLTPHAITLYTIGAKWGEILRVMLASAVQVCFPAFSHLSTQEDRQGIHKILFHGSRVAVGFGILGASLLILLAGSIIPLWVGPGFEEAIPLMKWLGMVGVFQSLGFPFEHYLRAIGQTRLLLRIMAFNSIISITASVFLIHQVGLIGVVWGGLAPLAASSLLLIIPRACRQAEISLNTFFKQLIMPLLLPIIWVCSLGVWFHLNPPAIRTFGGMMGWGLGIGVIYLTLWTVLDPIPRRTITRLRFRQRVPAATGSSPQEHAP